MTSATPRAAGEQPNGTFVVPACKDVNDNRTSAPHPAPKPPQMASTLVDEANALVDAYAEVLHRALTTYQGRVKPEEVRSLMVSAYIQRHQSAA